MPTKFKKFLTPFLIASVVVSIALFSNLEIFQSFPKFVQAPAPKVTIETFKRTGTSYKNCLIKCPMGTASDNILVDHEAIILSSNKKTKFADWVAYKSTVDYIAGPERKRNWAKDPKIDVQFTFTPQDYKGMSKDPYFFDRGHQAPLASFKNHPQWFTLNYLSNITPQKKDLNQGSWKDLESAERKLVKQYGEAYILTGPYYDKANHIKGPPLRFTYLIPSGYWKIIAIQQGNQIKTASFVFSQETPKKESYCKHLVSIPKIEQLTDLKFFDGKLPLAENGLKTAIGCVTSLKNGRKSSG